jgi:hypothetical protein
LLSRGIVAWQVVNLEEALLSFRDSFLSSHEDVISSVLLEAQGDGKVTAKIMA